MDEVDRIAVKSRCIDLSWAFAYTIDHGDFHGLAQLFTTDGVFDRLGQVLHGRAEILEAMTNRRTDVLTRHVFTNFHFCDVTSHTAEAVVYSLTYHGFGSLADGPLSMESPHLVEYSDQYQLSDEGWRFSSRRAQAILVPPPS